MTKKADLNISSAAVKAKPGKRRTPRYAPAKSVRARNEESDGFEISRAKTINAEIGDVYEAWGNTRRRAQWLPGVKLTIRKATENKTLRVTWSDGSNLEVSLHAKGALKTQIAAQHGRLPSARAAEKQKAFWGEAFNRLAQLLES